MYRDNNRLVLYRVILALALLSFLFAVQRASAISLLPVLSQPLQQICNGSFSSSFIFSIMLIVNLLLAYIKRRKRFCVAVAKLSLDLQAAFHGFQVRLGGLNMI